MLGWCLRRRGARPSDGFARAGFGRARFKVEPSPILIFGLGRCQGLGRAIGSRQTKSRPIFSLHRSPLSPARFRQLKQVGRNELSQDGVQLVGLELVWAGGLRSRQ